MNPSHYRFRLTALRTELINAITCALITDNIGLAVFTEPRSGIDALGLLLEQDAAEMSRLYPFAFQRNDDTFDPVLPISVLDVEQLILIYEPVFDRRYAYVECMIAP